MATDTQRSNRIKHILEDVTDVIDECTLWEQGFICNVEEAFRKHGELSEERYNKLEEVWERRCQ